MGIIDRLELENFKSYKGHQIIGPFKNFQAIIGPNGVGKSNIMDAISFVLCVTTAKLRSNKLQELIWRTPGEKEPYAKRSCYVKLVYKDDAGKEVAFTRMITAGSSSTIYKVDNKEVDKKRYQQRLADIGIPVKALNFLVFQGGVEAVAAKTPKELAQMLEQISGSDELKEEYERLKQEKEKMEENTMYSYQKKKGMNAEKKQFKAQKDEAEKYLKLAEERAHDIMEHVLWLLFHVDRDLRKFSAELSKKKKELEEKSSRESVIEQSLKEKKKEQAKFHKEVLKIEKEIRQRMEESQEKKPEEIKLEQEMRHVTNRLEVSRKSLEKLNEEYAKHTKDIQVLQSELEEIRSTVNALEEERKKQETTTVKLTNKQINEYQKLKEQVFARTSRQQQELSHMQRELEQEQENHDALERRLNDLQTRKEQLEYTGQQLQERRTKMNEFVTQNRERLEEVKKQLEEAKSANNQASKRQQELTALLEDVQSKLQEAKADVKESHCPERFNECLNDLKRLFPGVYGKVVDLCTAPPKYNIALTGLKELT